MSNIYFDMRIHQIRTHLQILVIIGVLICLICIPSTIGFSSDVKSVDDVKTIYLTGFGPFLNFSENPSELVVNILNQTTIEGHLIQGRILPVNFTEAPQIIQQDIEQLDPELIICLGLDASCKGLTIELIGMNLQYDSTAQKPLISLKRIQKHGPFILTTKLDVRQMYHALREDDIPVEMSISAGLYVCNTVFYQTLYYLHDESLEIPMGFIHIPLLENHSASGMSLDVMIDGIITILMSNIQ